jgi:hypothetical protein
MMQYTFGDMIGELFMKALALEEQRKVREEEKQYRGQIMDKQDRQFNQQLERELARDLMNQKQFDANKEFQNSTLAEQKSQFDATIRQGLVQVSDINSIPKNARQFVQTGKQFETNTQRNVFKNPQTEQQDESSLWIMQSLLNDVMKQEQDQKNFERSLSASYSSNPDNRKAEFYKYDKDGNLLQTILASPNEMKNTYLNPNDKNWETNKDYIFSSQPAMGNLLLNQQKFAKGQNNKYSTEAGIYSALSQAMGNAFANKFGGLTQLEKDGDYLSQFTPQLEDERTNYYAPGVMGVNIDNTSTKKVNNERWSNQKNANAQFVKGLLEETINPLAEVLEFLKSNAKTSTDVKGLQQIGATLGAMYPELDRMRMLFDKGMINDPDNELKKKFYEGLRKAQRYWQTESVLSQAIYNQKFKSKLQDAEIKNKIESIQD